MKILQQKIDFKTKSGILDVIPENADDIYNLYNIINQNDIIKSKTQRKVQITNGSQQKMTLLLEIVVESINVDLKSSFLFLKGKTVNEHEHIKKGSFHTIEITINHRFSIHKQEWNELNLVSIKNIQKNDENIFLIYITQKEFIFCEIFASTTKIKEKKPYKGKNYKNALQCISTFTINHKLIIIGSFLDVRNDFEKEFRTAFRNQENKICNIKIENNTNNVAKVVEEIFADPDTNKKLLNVQFVADINEYNIFIKNHAKNTKTCIGIKEIEEALDFGAVKSIIVTNTMFKSNDPEIRKQVEEICKKNKQIKNELYILPIKHKLGEHLNTLGGIVANLKYEYKDEE
ncbi:Translation factor pelota [Binucleata daphniae]